MFAGLYLYNNTIANNTIGVILDNEYGSPPPMNYNNIYGNTDYNVKNMGPHGVDAINNWWGTTDESAIDASIYDGRDDATLGLVDYQPFLDSELRKPFYLHLPLIRSSG